MPRRRRGDLRGRVVEHNENIPISGIRDNNFYHPFLAEPVPLWVLFDFYGPPTEVKPPPATGDENEELHNGPERVGENVGYFLSPVIAYTTGLSHNPFTWLPL